MLRDCGISGYVHLYLSIFSKSRAIYPNINLIKLSISPFCLPIHILRIQSRSTTYRDTKGRRDEEQISKEQMPYVKPLTHKEILQ